MSLVYSGKDVRNELQKKLITEIKYLKEGGIAPSLTILRIGEKAEDLSYERTVKKLAADYEIDVKIKTLDENCTTAQVEGVITQLNNDHSVHGVLMFRPLPKQLDERYLCSLIDVKKDVDCCCDKSFAALFKGELAFRPCTAEAVLCLTDYYGLDLKGKKVLIIGRSLVVGRPLALMCLERDATVTVAHSKTLDLKTLSRSADVIISCIGRSEFIDDSYFEGGEQVFIDVGINWNEAKQCITGDGNFELISKKVKAASIVPGGVGALTSFVLLRHVVEAARHLC